MEALTALASSIAVVLTRCWTQDIQILLAFYHYAFTNIY